MSNKSQNNQNQNQGGQQKPLVPPVEPTTETKEAPATETPTMEMFNKLVGLVTDVAESVRELKQKPQEAIIQAEEEPVEGTAPLPPIFRKVVDETLGKDFDGFMSYNGGTFLKLVVPMEKSNMDADERAMRSRDIRTKPLLANEGVDAIKAFCLKVKANLNRPS